MEKDDPLRILVIEDDQDARNNLLDILRLDNHDCEMAASTSEALSRSDWPTYAAIILDWTLSDGTAETLLPELRRLCPQAAVVVVTGTVGLQGTIAAIRHDVADYILKPLEAEGLRAALWRIAERRWLAFEKARSEAAFRALVEAAPCAILIFRSDRTLVYFSPCATRLIGYSLQEVLGKDYSALLIRDTTIQQRIDQEVQLVLASGSTRGFENPVWCKDGSRRWLVWNAERLDDYEGAVAVMAVGQDISARRLAEQRLMAEHATTRVLAEASNLTDAAPRLLCTICESIGWGRGEWWEFDPDSNSLRCQATWYRTAPGADEFEALSRAKIFAPGEGLPGSVWVAGTPVWLDEFQGEGKSTRALQAMAVGFRSEFAFPVLFQGRPLGVLVFFSHDPQPAEPELLSCMASLGGQIGQFLARRRAEERALQAERLNAIGQAMDGLIHEGRNALQRSQACLEMLAMRVESQAEAVALITRVQQAQDHLHNLYEKVRQYAAPLHLDRQMHRLGQILADAWDEVLVQTKAREVRFNHDESDLDLSAQVDGAAIRAVFKAILDNALAAAADPVEVDAFWSSTLVDGRPAFQVAIRDNGPGLPAEVRNKIFQPFITTKVRGLGLGLATAKRIVEAHGGTIAFGIGERSGSEILVILPRDGA